jgi:hypothetical protein
MQDFRLRLGCPAMPEPQTEYRVENDHGWFLDRATGETTEWVGVRFRWRFVGERKWRKQVIVAEPERGQTPESLREDAEKIVAVLARKASEEGPRDRAV